MEELKEVASYEIIQISLKAKIKIYLVFQISKGTFLPK